jgi:hypothetical protein
MKKYIGYILFVLGLLLAIGQTLEQYNNAIWHIVGFISLIGGLELIITGKIEETKK